MGIQGVTMFRHAKSTIRASLASSVLLSLCSLPSAIADDQIHILGWLEHARVMSVGIRMDAKLDTGAKTSAVHAEILSRDALSDDERAELREETDDDEEVVSSSDEDGADEEGEQPRRVVFRLTNEDGEARILEREVMRTVSIKKRSGGLEQRPVVELDLCIAGIRVKGEVSLADRTRFNYPLLIGRDMLESGDIAVNPDADYTASSRC